MRTDPLWNSGKVSALIAHQDPGGLIRIGREERGWRQADLGARIGCSASTVSRLEQRRTYADLRLIRHAAQEVGVPTNVLTASLGLAGAPTARVGTDGPRCAEEDPMRRRTLLVAAGLTAPAALLARVNDALANMPTQPDRPFRWSGASPLPAAISTPVNTASSSRRCPACWLMPARPHKVGRTSTSHAFPPATA